MNDQERQEALEAAVRDAVAAHARRSDAPRAVAARRGEAPLAAVILLGWALIGWIWIAEPAVIFGPSPAPAATPEQREARLRFGMYLLHTEIGAFAQDSGRLPRTLEELALDPADGVRLEFDSIGAWALVGADGEFTLRLTEAMSADSFLGTSLATLQATR